MQLTADELVVTIEALREYRLRVADGSRRFLCEALIYRYQHQLVEDAKTEFKTQGPT